MKVKIEVTREDIVTGKQRSSFSCPIALAAKRVGETWRIGANEVCRGKNGCEGHVRLPKEAEDFILIFDKNRYQALPFSFEAEILA